MARDIEEFLRRAAERRQQQGGAAPSRPTPSRPAPLPQEPMIIEDVEVIQPRRPAKRSDIRQESVDEHVKKHIDTSNIARHAESLGASIGQASQRTEQRVQQHLDHDISRVDDKPTITDDALNVPQGPTLASQLKASLGNPRSVGQAILLAEILKRPDLD